VPVAVSLAPAAITLMWVPTGSAGAWPILPLVLLAYGGLAVVGTALHGRLALDRPRADRLTEFYLLIAVGGAVAAIFVAIVAPVIFPGVWELPILLVLALVALAVSQGSAPPSALGRLGQPRPRMDFTPFVRGVGRRVGPYVVVAALLLALLIRDGALGTEAGLRWLLVGGLILLVGARPAFLAVSTAFVLALAVLVLQPPAEFRGRSFFGVTTVLRPAGTDFTILMNGTTSHGIQSRDPAKARIPESYYARPGPFGDLFRELALDGSPRRIAAVGLGAGAIATYLQPSWSMTFYEIDPLVATVASDPRWFTYLRDAASRPSIVLGDARLSLRDVPDATYDAIVVDAFSSDAIPAHLLTAEAMAEYLRVVKGGGIVLVHVSNRYYDLAPAVAAAAAANGLPAVRRVYVPTDADRAAGAAITDAVAVTSSDRARSDLRGAGWDALPTSAPPMTDDYLDLLRFLRPLW
jgi:SAM-dependent methyltransferase